MNKIAKIRRIEESIIRFGGNGDNWHMTWAQDDAQYVSLCDGSGFPGLPQKSYNSRAYRIAGDPPEIRIENIDGYPELLSVFGTKDINRYYNFGILALDDALYQFLSTPNRPFGEPEPKFAGIKLIYSPDLGRRWCNQDGSSPVVWEPWEERSHRNMLFINEPGDAFSLITVLQMGKNYGDNSDGYVYLYAPNGNLDGTMNQLVLCRVRKDHLLDREEYTFCAGTKTDGSATWSENIEDRGVIHTFPNGWVNTKIHPYAWHPSVVYYRPLGLYLMANWGMGCAPDGMWFGKPSYLGFWTSEKPWGPWTQVHEDAAWMPEGDSGARAYQPQISPKWIAPDGRSFWLVWTDFQEIDGKRPYYSFNLQKVELTPG